MGYGAHDRFRFLFSLFLVRLPYRAEDGRHLALAGGALGGRRSRGIGCVERIAHRVLYEVDSQRAGEESLFTSAWAEQRH